jgi:hypothetical protein
MRAWTEREDEQLREACAARLSSPEIAVRLGRSRQAINGRVHKRIAPAARFWAKVAKGDGCWLWTASVFENGYGLFHCDERNVKAHRFAYELCVGPIPEGLEVRHRCDVPRCVNPDHLEVGTHAENMADMVRRGRVARGARNGRSIHGRRAIAR